MLDYGENPWPNDRIRGQTGSGAMYNTMVLGGPAMHWGGAVPRFSPEDFRLRSLYGVADDWPISFDDIEPYYQEAEERIGVAGEPGPPDCDPRSKPYPMPPLPLSYGLARIREWTERTEVPFWTQPWARNTEPYQGRNVCRRCDTCYVCPTGAKYTPDFAFDRLLAAGSIDIAERTLVRRLRLAPDSDRIVAAEAVDRDAPDGTVEFRAGTFVLAAGHAWSSHLLLLSANSRFPDGLANRAGNVGLYMTGHWYIAGFIDLPMRLYPGMFDYNSILSRRFASPGPIDRYLRHDLRLWESTVGPRSPPQGRRRTPLVGRRSHGGLESAHRIGVDGAHSGLLRRPSQPGQSTDAEPRPEERAWRSDAAHRLSPSAGDGGPAGVHAGHHHRAFRVADARRRRIAAQRGTAVGAVGAPRRRVPHGR